MMNVTAKFISLMCSGFTENPDDCNIGLATLEDITNQMPPYVYGEIHPDDMTDVQEL